MELTKKHKLILLAIAIVIFTGISIREVIQLRSKTYILASTSETTNAMTNSSENFTAENGAPFSEEVREAAPPQVIMVHVEGKVERPGVYQLEEGDRVIDAVEMAGGLRPEADRKRVNMAQILRDEMFLYVPQQGEESEMEINFANAMDNTNASGNSPGQGSLVNINIADAGTLETLPGIGPVLAQRIIDHRQQSGNFSRIEDLMDVTGIGDARYRDVRDRITVR